MKSKQGIAVILLCSLILSIPGFTHAAEQTPIQAPETFEQAQEFGKGILQGLPGAIKSIWDTQVVPLWAKMWSIANNIWDSFIFPWLKALWEKVINISSREVEKRQPLIKEELEKEKQELQQEIEERVPEPGKTLWERLRGLF